MLGLDKEIKIFLFKIVRENSFGIFIFVRYDYKVILLFGE